MSRHEAQNDKGQQFVYGFDNPLREYFMQIYHAEQPADWVENYGDDEFEPYWETLVGTMSNTYGGHVQLLEAIEKHGVKIPDEHRNAITFVLPF